MLHLIALNAIPKTRWKNGRGGTRELAIYRNLYSTQREHTLDSTPQIQETAQKESSNIKNFDWRVSLVDIDQELPFSLFPDVDRTLIFTKGSGIRLSSLDAKAGTHPSLDYIIDTPLTAISFPGELPLIARMYPEQRQGEPPLRNQDFNIMVRRDVYKSEYETLTNPPPDDSGSILFCKKTIPVAREGILWVVSGEWSVHSQKEAMKLVGADEMQADVNDDEDITLKMRFNGLWWADESHQWELTALSPKAEMIAVWFTRVKS